MGQDLHTDRNDHVWLKFRDLHRGCLDQIVDIIVGRTNMLRSFSHCSKVWVVGAEKVIVVASNFLCEARGL